MRGFARVITGRQLEDEMVGQFARSESAMIITFAQADLLVVPSLIWLYCLAQRRSLGEGEIRGDSTEVIMRGSEEQA